MSGVESPSAESILESQSLQDGGPAHSEGSAVEGGLDDENQSERCIFLSSHSSPASEFPEVQMARKMFPIYLPSIRLGISPMSLHKGFETSVGVLTEQRDKVRHLP